MDILGTLEHALGSIFHPEDEKKKESAKKKQATKKTSAQQLREVKAEAFTSSDIDTTVDNSPNWVLDGEDETNELLSNLTWVRNQLGKEVLESFLEYDEKDYNDKTRQWTPNALEEEFDEDKKLSLKYNNKAYLEEEQAYAQNVEGVAKTKSEIDVNRSVADLILEWKKTGKLDGMSADLSFFGFPGNTGNWDLAASIRFLESNTGTESKHQCAKYVRMALEAGGLSTAGRPVNAKEYVHFLPSIGFKYIRLVKYDAPYATYMKMAMPGDIAVMECPKGGPGHICMYTGKQWISDFKQNRAWVYGGQCGLLYIFRYAQIQQGVGMGALAGGSTGISNEMLNIICKFETGHSFGYAMSSKDLNGYDNHDAHGHRTYGYGLLYTADGRSYMDLRKTRWTQRELESEYMTSVGNRVRKIRAALGGTNVTQPQIDAMTCIYYNMGGFLSKPIFTMIKQNPSNPAIFNQWCHLSDKMAAKYPGLKKRRIFEANWYFGRKTPQP